MKVNPQINTEYWRDVIANEIIGTYTYPGNELVELLPDRATILDLGCGNGKISEYLANKGFNVIGIDINQDAIQRNQSKPNKANYLLGDITQPLPFSNQSFNAVIASFTLLNIIPVREKVVLELGRVLKPHGLVWLNEALVSESYSKRYELSRPFVENDHDFFVLKDPSTSISVQTLEEMRHLIQEAKMARITHHFTVEELRKLFAGYTEIYSTLNHISSPNTKSIMNTIVAIFQLK